MTIKVKSNKEIMDFLSDYAEGVGVKLKDVEFKQGKNPVLTLFIDKVGGIDLDTCEKFHNAIFEPIDELDPTFGVPYTLNVSSMGLDRPYKTEQDFIEKIGQKIEVKLYSSVKGKKAFDGILVSVDKDNLILKVDEKTTLTIDRKNIVKANDYIDF